MYMEIASLPCTGQRNSYSLHEGSVEKSTSSFGIICAGCNFSFRRPKKVTSKNSLRCRVAVIPFSPHTTYESEGMCKSDCPVPAESDFPVSTDRI